MMMQHCFEGFKDLRQMNVLEACDYMKVDRQAIYVAIGKGLLKAEKVEGKYAISERTIDDYVSKKYNRRYSIYDGKPLFNDDEFSPQEVAKMINTNKSYVYYMVRCGIIKSYRKGSAYIIKQEWIDDYLKTRTKI